MFIQHVPIFFHLTYSTYYTETYNLVCRLMSKYNIPQSNKYFDNQQNIFIAFLGFAILKRRLSPLSFLLTRGIWRIFTWSYSLNHTLPPRFSLHDWPRRLDWSRSRWFTKNLFWLPRCISCLLRFHLFY